MAIEVVDLGINNQLDAPADFLHKQCGTIAFEGSHNHISIGRESNSDNCYIHCGTSSIVHIGDYVRLAKVRIFWVAPSKLIIAEFTSFVGAATISAHEAADVTIGHNCLIADEVTFSVSDMHSVVNVDNGVRLNPAKPIILGHRVWIGARSTVLKGTMIGDGSFVGAHSLVRGEFPSNVLAAGVPAKILRTGVTWRTELI